MWAQMVEVKVSGPDVERLPVAHLIEQSLLAARFTLRRFKKGAEPTDKTDGTPEQVRIVEEE